MASFFPGIWTILLILKQSSAFLEKVNLFSFLLFICLLNGCSNPFYSIPDFDGRRQNTTQDTRPRYKNLQYTVKKGDTLGEIARRFTGSSKNWPALAEFNNITNPIFIKPGQVIIIPNYLLVQRRLYSSYNKSRHLRSNSNLPKGNSTSQNVIKSNTKYIKVATSKNQSLKKQKNDILNKKSDPIKKPSNSSRFVRVILSPLDPASKKKVDVMSGPGPPPIFKKIGQIPVGKKVESLGIENNYVIIKFNDNKAYLFIKNAETID